MAPQVVITTTYGATSDDKVVKLTTFCSRCKSWKWHHTHKAILPLIWQISHWRHNERDGLSSHRYLDCLLNRLFRCRSKTISKLRITGLCEGNSPVTDEFPAQRASNAEKISIWWRQHEPTWVWLTEIIRILMNHIPLSTLMAIKLRQFDHYATEYLCNLLFRCDSHRLWFL